MVVGGEWVLEARGGENAQQALDPEGPLLLTVQAAIVGLGEANSEMGRGFGAELGTGE